MLLPPGRVWLCAMRRRPSRPDSPRPPVRSVVASRSERSASPSGLEKSRRTHDAGTPCHRRWFRAPARCRPEAGPVAVKMPSGGSAERLDGDAGLERRPPVGTALRDRAAHGTAPSCGMVLSRGATGRKGRAQVSVAQDDVRHVARGPSARCADRRSAFQAVTAIFMPGGVRRRTRAGAFLPVGAPSRGCHHGVRRIGESAFSSPRFGSRRHGAFVRVLPNLACGRSDCVPRRCRDRRHLLPARAGRPGRVAPRGDDGVRRRRPRLRRRRGARPLLRAGRGGAGDGPAAGTRGGALSQRRGPGAFGT